MPAEAVHIIDDDPSVRDSLRVLLEAAGFAVTTYESAVAFLTASPMLRGCVLTDLCMPDIDGLELQRRLNELGLPLSVIVMTGHGQIPLAVGAMKAGAVDFLEKPFEDVHLLEAIGRALDSSRHLEQDRMARAEAAIRLGSLTPREREVLDLLVAGLPTKAIASKLGASPRTIEVHRSHVLEKLGSRSVPELVHFVLRADPARVRGHSSSIGSTAEAAGSSFDATSDSGIAGDNRGRPDKPDGRRLRSAIEQSARSRKRLAKTSCRPGIPRP